MKNTWVDEVPAAVLLCNNRRFIQVNVNGQVKTEALKHKVHKHPCSS